MPAAEQSDRPHEALHHRVDATRVASTTRADRVMSGSESIVSCCDACSRIAVSTLVRVSPAPLPCLSSSQPTSISPEMCMHHMSSGALWYGTSFTALREHAFAWLDDRAGETPQSARFVEDNDYQRDAIADAWREHHDGLRLSVSGLSAFASAIHERLFGPYPDVETLERRRMLEQALQTVDTDLDNPRQHAGVVSELVRALEADGVLDVSTLHDRLAASDCRPRSRELLGSVYEQYLDLRGVLGHPAARSHSEKLAAVADADDPLDATLPHLDAIVVSGLVDPSAVELAVLERLAAEFPVVVLLPTPTPEEPTAGVGATLTDTIEALCERGFEPERVEAGTALPLQPTAARLYRPVAAPGHPPDELTWHEAPTPDREIRHLARRLRERLGEHSPDELLVLAPGLLSYREGLADTFETYGIDHAYRVTLLLERTYVGQAVLDAVALCERPRADRLARLAANPLVALPAVDAAELADCQRRLYTTAVDPLVAELDESTVEGLLDRTAAVREADADGLVPAVEGLLSYLGLDAAVDGLDDGVIDTGYERQARDRVLEILDSVALVCAELSPTEPLAELANALEGVRVQPPPRATDGRVEVVGLQDTPMAEFEELYVLGATAEHLPGRETRPRYFQTIGESLGLFEPHERRDRNRYRFGTLLANARRVHVTTPEATINDEQLLPSPFLAELVRSTGLEPTGGADEPRGSREDLQRAMAGATPDELEPALAAAARAGHVSEAFTVEATRGAECSAHRAEAKLTAHDGQLSADAVDALDGRLTEAPYSHSRLSQYARCGFRYMLLEGWDMADDDEIEPGVSPMTVGSVVHETLERFYRTLQSEPGDPVDLGTTDRATLERLLFDAGVDAVEHADEAFDDVFAGATLEALFAGLVTPEVNDYYGPTGRTATDGTLVRFLDTELARAENGHRPAYFETSFGGSAGVSLPDGRRLPVRGVIDRIDVTGDTVSVFDYKVSRVYSVRDRENKARDGVDFQLPLYALGTPSLFPDREPHPVDAATHYYVLNTQPEVTVRRALSSRFDDIDFGSFLDRVVPDRIERATGGIESGAFQPAVVGERTARCAYCSFRDVCDVRHHRRYEVVDTLEAADGAAYVPDGVRPGDISEYLPGGDSDA